MIATTLKPRKSKLCRCGCGERFIPSRQIQPTRDNFDCKVRYAEKVAAKSAAKREQLERAEFKKRREALKKHGDCVKEAQAAINKFRRFEELAKGRGCISCRRSQQEVIGTDGWKPGGAWDAGHFLSVGSHPELRFEPKNIWLQCKSCNGGSGKYAKKAATVAAAYKENLISQEGADLVEWLEGPHVAKHYSKADLIELRDEYRAKLRALRDREAA